MDVKELLENPRTAAFSRIVEELPYRWRREDYAEIRKERG